MGNNKGRKSMAERSRHRKDQQKNMARTLDALAEFDKFNESILPMVKKAIMENWSPERMRKHFAPMIQGRMVEKALKGDYKAMKDTLDRHEGMAVQRVEQKTVYQQMGNQELAALALQKFRDAGMLDAEFKVVVDEAVEE